jgi:predicted transcriptional regulator
MASKLVAFRLPDDLIRAIEAAAEATGKDKTAVVVAGLRQVFELPTADPTLAAVQGINERMDRLEQRMYSLSEEVRAVLEGLQQANQSSKNYR